MMAGQFVVMVQVASIMSRNTEKSIITLPMKSPRLRE
jgi:hypothetical protein